MSFVISVVVLVYASVGLTLALGVSMFFREKLENNQSLKALAVKLEMPVDKIVRGLLVSMVVFWPAYVGETVCVSVKSRWK